MATSPNVVTCPTCHNVGMSAHGKNIQYCMCPLGRHKKMEWKKHPQFYPRLRDRNGQVITRDWLGTGRAAEEHISETLPDLDDRDIWGGAA